MAQLGWILGLVMLLFAINLWGVMHTTPARQDSFIGSETQGYMLMVGLFFRPAIAAAALSMSFVIAPPVVKLINLTLLPMLQANNESTGIWSLIIQSIFGLILYMSVVKAAMVMIFMAPQAFPDEVLRIISAGIGDLGQSKALSTAEASEHSARAASTAVDQLNKAGGEHIRGVVGKKRDEKKAAMEAAAAKRQDELFQSLAGNAKPGTVGGTGGPNG